MQATINISTMLEKNLTERKRISLEKSRRVIGITRRMAHSAGSISLNKVP
jgi:hypothetical protein